MHHPKRSIASITLALALGLGAFACSSGSRGGGDGGPDGDTDTDSGSDSDTETVTDTEPYAPQACGEDDIVVFTDPKLEAAVRKSIGTYVFEQGWGSYWGGDLTGSILDQLDKLWFASNEGIESLEGVECLKNVVETNLNENQLTDIDLLFYLDKLEIMRITDNEISEIESLAGLNSIESLILDDNDISDLGPLAGLSSLRTLSVSGNPVESMEPIAGLTGLESLGAAGLGLTSLDWVENLTNLWGLTLSNNALSDLGPLAEHTQLVSLYLDGNQVADISALAGHDELLRLDLSDNQIVDLSPLATASAGSLWLSNNQIEDISPLAEMGGSMGALFLDGNRIVGISPLESLPNLVELALWDNRIEDLSPLAAHPISQDDDISGWSFWRNNISDISPLASFARLDFLDISENPVTDLSPLAGKRINDLYAGSDEIHSLVPLLGVESLDFVDLHDNRVTSLAPLYAWARMAPDEDAIEILPGNPLGELAAELDAPRLCATLKHELYYGDGLSCEWNDDPIDLPGWDPDPEPYDEPQQPNPEGCDAAPGWLSSHALPGPDHGGADFALDDSTPSEPIVEDLVTGLRWRRCSEGQSLSGDECQGSGSALSWDEALAACDGAYGGHDDWRLPSASELASLVDHAVGYPGPTIDAAAFPATYTGSYWSSSAVPSTSQAVGWSTNFYNGETCLTRRDEDAFLRVRCVRGGVAEAPWEERFAEQAADGSTIADAWTGLEWSRCAAGQSWDGASCLGVGDAADWQEAQTACAGELAGHDDWRLPSVSELSSIANRCGADPAAHSEAFPGLPGAPFWSSTIFVDSLPRRWAVDLGFGCTTYLDEEDSARIRCVREI